MRDLRPTILYKRNNTGKIQRWEVWTKGATLFTRSGLVDGKLVTSSDTIREGKNLGTVKETTPTTQAQAEARSKLQKQLKKGYVRDIKQAKAGKVDTAVIKGGWPVMLAESYDDFKDKITFPCYFQPKLNGHRCAAQIKKASISLWSRKRERITSMPHIERELRRMFGGNTLDLDGELFRHSKKDNFDRLSSLITKKKSPSPNADYVQYHVYDMRLDAPFNQRIQSVEGHLGGQSSIIVVVPTHVVNSHEEIFDLLLHYRRLRYEGGIIRWSDEHYKERRVRFLLKLKRSTKAVTAAKTGRDLMNAPRFEDAEFKIIRLEEGRGKLQGHVGAFICVTKEGVEFGAKMKGDGVTVTLKHAWENPDCWIGKRLTVAFSGYTKDNVPLFPVALCLKVQV